MRTTSRRCSVPKRDLKSAIRSSTSSPRAPRMLVERPERANSYFRLLLDDRRPRLEVQFRGTRSLVGSVQRVSESVA